MGLVDVSIINIHHLVFIFLLLQTVLVMSCSYKISKPGCPDKCGNVSIPYPFGIGEENCFLDQNYSLTCNEISKLPQLVLVGQEVLRIDLQGQLQTTLRVASDCYEKNGSQLTPRSLEGIIEAPFSISETRNKLVAIGCDTLALITGPNYESGCISTCASIDNVINGSCSGIGCCQASIPRGLTNYTIRLISMKNHNETWDFNPCSYAFLAEENWYNFSSLDLKDNQNRLEVPVVIDWVVGNETCEQTKKNPNVDYACGENSYCYNSPNGYGYRCNCSNGYEGNPYLGCQDINECSNKTLNDCSHVCNNKVGYYTCSCPGGYNGDGRNLGNRCSKIESSLWIKITLGIGIGILILLVISSWLYWGFKKRKLMQIKEKFYKQNGGLMLEKIMNEQHTENNLNVKIFTDEELKKATDNYDESRIIGKGGFGTVYKGILTGNTAVAIKKSKIVDQTQTVQFINEVVVLSQIRHRNVVKLLGCCLENEVPLLVYEFVANGTLFQHLHEEGRVSLLSWETRLRIAAEIATSLSYLHSEASIPIIHRDVKSMNILLDENHTAKVADFGASRLVPLDQTQLSTIVQGTLGYLDPEYLQTTQLTEKSDVYSFGILLAELLTGKKALSYDVKLATYFISAMKEDRLFQILEEQIVIQASVEHLEQVAELTKRCLRVKGEKRPTMKEVVIILDGLRSPVKHSSAFDNKQDKEEKTKLAEATNSYTGTGVVGYDSLIELVPSSSGR